ncbi:ATP synthase subunit delta [Actinoplanes cyaneus]|uniref:ATP synthase subunit delta n=1 Tax=Actinoplanes cyaneus TaxID=52696 RepID=A0A919IMR2_9ACTN|nr:F0F1 ATP synthase subunit delta [Actinoplanes cyaneus]MCW2141407.1 ATP synthase F1 subcomplex delta subunit [Actinoplanes cyaneus]GID68067.1 ATP synthase subunit delta [Actinoplanes cyaneus]
MASGVTNQAYGDAAERLHAGTAASTDAQLVTVADEILSVAGLLRGQPRLRRALTDPSRPGDDRSDLFRSLLAGKATAVTVDALATLVAGRFSKPSDLLDATERLGVDTMLASAQKQGVLAEVEDELFRFSQIVSGTPQLAATLSDIGAPVAPRAKLVGDLLDGKAQAVTVRLVQVALVGFGGRGFEASLNRLVEATAARRDREVAYVTVAKPLGDAEETALAAKLAAIYGRQVSLKVDVNPAIIGGVSVRVGSDLYDGTILRRLNAAKQAFAK